MERVGGGPQAVMGFHGPEPGSTRPLLGLERNGVKLGVDLLTGHNTLSRHLTLIGVVQQVWCLEKESSFNILCECDVLSLLQV